MGLLDLFQPATPDPLGRVLGASYDEGDQRWAGISEALGAASNALLNPRQGGGGGWARAIGDIGGAMGAAGTAYKEGKTDYLYTAAKNEIAKREIERKKRLEDQEIAQDQAMVDLVAKMKPEERAWAQANPEEWYKDALGRQYSGGTADWGVSPPRMVDEAGNIFYRQFSKGGETKIVSETPGARPVGQLKMVETAEGMRPLDPYTGKQVGPTVPGSDPASIKSAEVLGSENRKNLLALPKNIQQSAGIIDNIDDVLSRPDIASYIGLNSVWKDLPSTQTNAVKAEMAQIAGQFRLQAIALWRGMGQFTEAEGQASVDAATAASQAQNPADFFYNMNKAKWHAEYARRIAMRQLETGDTTKYYSPQTLMPDYPKPKRSDYANAGKPAKEEAPVPGSELEKALEAYPD